MTHLSGGHSGGGVGSTPRSRATLMGYKKSSSIEAIGFWKGTGGKLCESWIVLYVLDALIFKVLIVDDLVSLAFGTENSRIAGSLYRQFFIQ